MDAKLIHEALERAVERLEQCQAEMENEEHYAACYSLGLVAQHLNQVIANIDNCDDEEKEKSDG